MLWIKSLHIVFVVMWFAGLFYLPRLFVYHAMSTDFTGSERFKIMERKLLLGIMTPSALLAVATGLWLWLGWGFSGGWLHAKVGLVAVLIAYHIWCAALVQDFKHDRNSKSHRWFRWFNEAPVLLLVGIVILVVVKPI